MNIWSLFSSQSSAVSFHGDTILGAIVSWEKGQPHIGTLFQSSKEIGSPVQIVKPLDTQTSHTLKEITGKAPLTVAVKIADCLIKTVDVPVTKSKEVELSYPFQTETQIPFPLEEAVLNRIILEKKSESTLLTVLAVPKKLLHKELAVWEQLGLIPEIVSAEAVALSLFAQHFAPTNEPLWVIHFDPDTVKVVLCFKGKLLKAYSFSCKGLGASELSSALSRALLGITRSMSNLGDIGFLITGAPPSFLSLDLPELKNSWQQPLKELPTLPPETLQSFALPIGIALSGLPEAGEVVNFRKEEFADPHVWERLKKPFVLFFGASLILSLALVFFTNMWTGWREGHIKEGLAKLMTEQGATTEEIDALNSYSENDLLDQMEKLQKKVRSTPDIYPLLPQIPRVSDFLTWLKSHPNFVFKDQNDNTKEQALVLESLNYTMVKRPEASKRKERYQVRVELEFSTSTPRLAREFHDALLTPNTFIDPKEDIKWTTTRGSYKALFYLKDRTAYP